MQTESLLYSIEERNALAAKVGPPTADVPSSTPLPTLWQQRRELCQRKQTDKGEKGRAVEVLHPGSEPQLLETVPRNSDGNSQKRVAFATVSMAGHFRLALSLAEEMTSRGYKVDFLIAVRGVTERMRAMAREKPGFTLHAIQEGYDSGAVLDWGKVASSSGRLGGSKVALFSQFAEKLPQEGVLPALIDCWMAMKGVLEEVQPDVILFDHSHDLLQKWAQSQQIPSIILHTPYYQTGPATGCARSSAMATLELKWLMARRKPMAPFSQAGRALGLDGQGGSSAVEGEAGAGTAQGSSPHTFVFCEPELLHTANLPARVHAVGPCLSMDSTSRVDEALSPWLEEAAARGERVLYVAMGTLGNGFLTSGIVGTLLDAFVSMGEGWRVLWSLPEAQQPLLSESGRPFDAARLRVESFVCQRAVLDHRAVSLFLTHGGQSSVNEGLAAGVPLVCLPLFCDQYEMAEAVFRHGLGLVFHKDEAIASQSERLAQLVQRVATESHFSDMAKRYAQLLRLRAGSGRGADLIESIVHAGADFQELWQGPRTVALAAQMSASGQKQSFALKLRGYVGVCSCIDGLTQWQAKSKSRARVSE